jgi:hypothetical protein
MPLNLSTLSPEDVAAATAAIEASWKERELCEMEKQRVRGMCPSGGGRLQSGGGGKEGGGTEGSG